MTDLTSGANEPLAFEDAPGAGVRGERSRAGMDYAPRARTGAFRAAGRHTMRVRFLRRAIILGAVIVVTTIAIVAAFDPFGHLPGAVSVAGVGVRGTKITVDSPKISGVQAGGGPYEIAAKAGIQDITTPGIIELEGVDAKVGMADTTSTHIMSSHGLYDSKADSMSLDGDVRIANSSGYTFNMKSALMDFHQGVFASHERLRVDLKGGEVNADDMAISNNGHVIAFRGHIASRFDAPDEAPAAVADADEAR